MMDGNLANSKCYEASLASSCVSLPPTLITPKPFRSKIPVPNSASGSADPPKVDGKRNVLRREMSLPPDVHKSCLDIVKVSSKPPISPRPSYARSNSSLSLFNGSSHRKVASMDPRGSMDLLSSKIPVWSRSTEKLNSPAPQIPSKPMLTKSSRKKWESCSSLEVSSSIIYLSKRFHQMIVVEFRFQTYPEFLLVQQYLPSNSG